MQIGVWIQE